MISVAITTLYISFGASGYLSFGPDTKDIITLNLLSEESSTFVDFAGLVKLFLCISLFFSYPIMMFPVTRMLQRKCTGFNQPNENSHSQSTLKMLPMLIRFILVTLSGLIVCVVPNFSTLMNIIGAVFGTLLAFIMPGFCHYAIFRNNIRRADIIMDYMLIVIGCIGCILGVIEALYGETPEMVNAVALENRAMPAALQDTLKSVGNNLNPSDNSTLNVHSTGDHNVIEADSNIAEAIAKSINVASSAVTEKISSVISKVGHSNTSNVINDVINIP